MPTKPYRSCVGIMLINQKNQIFAGERNNIEDAWQMPQGGIDAGEKPLTTAYRELLEEAGIPKIDVTLLAEHPEWLAYDFPPKIANSTSMTTKFCGQKQKWFLFQLNKKSSPINLDNAEHNEFTNWKWVNENFLLQYVGTFKQQIYKKVFSEFQKTLYK